MQVVQFALKKKEENNCTIKIVQDEIVVFSM